MVKLSELPREPQEAFQTVLSHVLGISSTFPQANLNPQIRTKAIAYIRTLLYISTRLANSQDYREPLTRALAAINQSNASGTFKILSTVEELFIANTLDDHFLNPDDEHQFNSLDWQKDDREAVIQSLDKARQFTRLSDDFSNPQKQKILYWISKAENEVIKDQGKLASILSAVDQIMDSVRRNGEKAKPLGDLVEQVRTKTVKNVVEVRQISAPDEQKKLPPPPDKKS